MHRNAAIRFFVVFEPSYSLGCLALLSSMARHASSPVSVDILLRRHHCHAADQVIDRLKREYRDKIILRPVIMPQEVLEKCAAYKFKAHFIPEVLFRLYYFDLVADQSDTSSILISI